jgi:DNA end-binding protein Ku
MHTMWKGLISFGLVNIPIKLYAATEDKDIKTRYLHQTCHTPIKYEKRCPVCNKEVEMDQIVRGVEVEPEKFVILTSEELDTLQGEKNKTIEIVDFVKLEEIDPIYYQRSYFVGPDSNSAKAYLLLKQAMQESGRIGVAKITIRSKEQLAAVRVYQRGLILETMVFPDEVRNIDHVPGIPEEIPLPERELRLAKQLIDQLTTSFNPMIYRDERRESLAELIQQKVSGQEIKAVQEAPRRNVVDLMEALQASIEETTKRTTRQKKTV